MIPHFLNNYEVLLGCDSTCTHFLIGALYKANDVTQVYALIRLRWSAEEGCFYRSRRHPTRKTVKFGKLFEDDFYTSYDWWEGPQPEGVQVLLAPRHVHCNVHAAGLKEFAALVSKFEGDDQLVAVYVSPWGVALRSLGEAAYEVEVPHEGKHPADKGIGSCVVHSTELKRALKECSGLLALAVMHQGTHRDRVLVFNSSPIWTIARHVPERVDYVYKLYPLADALRRVSKFASYRTKASQPSRPLLERVACYTIAGGALEILASDGTAVHLESLTNPALPGSFDLPSSMVKLLPAGASLALAFTPTETRLRLHLRHTSITISVIQKPLPPYHTLYLEARVLARTTLTAERSDNLLEQVSALAAEVDDYGEASVYLSRGPSSVGLSAAPLPASPHPDDPFASDARVDVLRLHEALSALQGPLQLAIDPNPRAPVYFRTANQEHLLAPLEASGQ